MWHNVVTLPGAVLALLRLGVATNFNFDGAYWKWRWQTAWGNGEKPKGREKLRAMMEYARWVARMRRM
jgi:hypothetical protein